MEISDRLKAFRAAIALKQEEMAAQSGVSYSVYQKYELGRSIPGGEAIAGFVRLGINANWLLTGDGPMLLADLHSAPSGALDMNRLQMALQATEEGLSDTQSYMDSDKKAELVLAVYELLEESGVNKERVLKLIKLVA